MSIFVLFVVFAVGVALTMFSGEIFVNSSGDIAKRWGIPKFVIGATIVSFATTLPELIVSAFAASEGRVDMAIGNGIGSVIANMGLILALAVMVKPIIIDRKQFGRKGVILIFGLILLWFLTNDGLLKPAGIVLLFITLGVFVVESVVSAKRETSIENYEIDSKKSTGSYLKNIVYFVLGAGGITLGARVLVNSGSEIAMIFGVGDELVAKTMIAVGTSLPELVTAIVAIRKGENAMVAGNILGANIIDTLLILPVCGIIGGGTLPVSVTNTIVDMPTALILATIFIVPTIFTKRIQRWQGFTGLVAYGMYLVGIFIA